MRRSDSSASLLEELLDKQAITELLHRYARGCDRADEATLRACFAHHSVHRHGNFIGLSQDFCSHAIAVVSHAMIVRHQITNIIIEIKGDKASSECMYQAYHRLRDEDGGSIDYFNAGRYLDDLERLEGGWVITSRLGLIDFERSAPATHPGPSDSTQSIFSQKFPNDALYRHITNTPD
jgi:hypothetical protein